MEKRPVVGAIDLHGFTAVAELKRQLLRPRRCGQTHLHGFTAVAELKLIQLSTPPVEVALFASPRLHRRGRIEARLVVNGRNPAHPHLHGFTAVAELKLREVCPLGPRDESSPRLHRRGRIEAYASISVILSFRRYLHGFTAVAELKQIGLKGFQGIWNESPRLHRRGRIEAISR